MAKKKSKAAKAAVSSTWSATPTVSTTVSSTSSPTSLPPSPTVSDVSTTSTPQPVKNVVSSCRNKGWTNPEQYDLLSDRIPSYQQHSADGMLPAFKAELMGGWQTRWPERQGRYFLDRAGKVRKVPDHLFGVMDSPEDAPFPKMVGGILTLGPNHCLDGCDFADPKDEGNEDMNGELSREADPEVEGVCVALGLALDERCKVRFYYSHIADLRWYSC